MMRWLAAWWKQIVGPPHVDPWNDDPRIVAERQDQHVRIDKAAALSAHDQLEDRFSRRWRDSWRPLP